jgi:hypothetical protein
MRENLHRRKKNTTNPQPKRPQGEVFDNSFELQSSRAKFSATVGKIIYKYFFLFLNQMKCIERIKRTIYKYFDLDNGL